MGSNRSEHQDQKATQVQQLINELGVDEKSSARALFNWGLLRVNTDLAGAAKQTPMTDMPESTIRFFAYMGMELMATLAINRLEEKSKHVRN